MKHILNGLGCGLIVTLLALVLSLLCRGLINLSQWIWHQSWIIESPVGFFLIGVFCAISITATIKSWNDDRKEQE